MSMITDFVRAIGIHRWQGRPAALIVLAIFLALRWNDAAIMEDLRLAWFDQLQRWEPREVTSMPVVIVDIDEYSLEKYGQWPWPRTQIAAVVDRIADGGGLVLGVDILFAEDDRFAPAKLADVVPGLSLEMRDAMRALPSADAVFANSIARMPVVFGMGGLETVDGSDVPQTWSRTPAVASGVDSQQFVPVFNDFLRSVDTLTDAAAGQGSLSVVAESDGVIRRFPMVVRVGNDLFPGLSLEMLRAAQGLPVFTVSADAQGVQSVAAGQILIPTNDDGRTWVHFSPHLPTRYVSAAQVIDGDVPAEVFNRRLVLLGTTGLGLNDFIITPLEPSMPGVEVHAQLLETIIGGTVLTRPRLTNWLELAAIAVLGFAFIVFQPMLRPLASLAFPIVGVAGLGAVSWFLFREQLWLVDPTFPAISITVTYGVLLAAALVLADAARRVLQADLEREKEAAQRLEGELNAAREIQMGILPRDFPAFPDIPSFDLYANLEPARAVGGDLYDFAVVHDRYLFFLVGDVSGKGVPASLFMALSKALYKSAALRGKPNIGAIMTEANAEISRENPAMLFVTVLSGLLDLQTGEMQLCNAGHDAPYRLRTGEAPVQVESDGGPPLCVLDDFEFMHDTVTLEPGDTMVIFTDGVTEAMNIAEDFYTVERVGEIFSKQKDAGTWDAKTVIDFLLDDVREFVGEAEPSDDITAMAVRFNGPAGA